MLLKNAVKMLLRYKNRNKLRKLIKNPSLPYIPTNQLTSNCEVVMHTSNISWCYYRLAKLFRRKVQCVRHCLKATEIPETPEKQRSIPSNTIIKHGVNLFSRTDPDHARQGWWWVYYCEIDDEEISITTTLELELFLITITYIYELHTILHGPVLSLISGEQ